MLSVLPMQCPNFFTYFYRIYFLLTEVNNQHRCNACRIVRPSFNCDVNDIIIAAIPTVLKYRFKHDQFSDDAKNH